MGRHSSAPVGMTIVLTNRMAEIPRLSRLVSQFWTRHALPPPAENDVNLALEEALANVIMHAYPGGGRHEITVRLGLEPGSLTVAVEDDGVPFNPLEASQPDIQSPVEQRRVGGLGIHLVRHVMDRLEYRREDGRNRLLMTKRLFMP